jgi:hypothetical protein
MIGLLTQPSVAIDGSKFKAVNNRDKNFTRAKMERRMAQIEESVARWGTVRNSVCGAIMMKGKGASYGYRERPAGRTFSWA